MSTKIRQWLLDEILGGDPLVTLAEAAPRLGVTVDRLRHLAEAGKIAGIQPFGPGGDWRFRDSTITQGRPWPVELAAQPPQHQEDTL